MPFEEPRQRAFVLLRRERTGRIDQYPTAAQHVRRTVENPRLSFRTESRKLRRPFVLRRVAILAEHALTGARRIYDNFIKKSGKVLREPFRSLIEHHTIGNPHALDALREHRRARGIDFICHEQTRAAHASRQMGGFPARCGTQIEHGFSRLCIRQRADRHCGRLLNIICPRFIIRMPSGAFGLRIEKSFFCPRHRCKRKRCMSGKRRRRNF